MQRFAVAFESAYVKCMNSLPLLCSFSGGRDGFVLKYDNLRWNASRHFTTLQDEVTDRWEYIICYEQTISRYYTFHCFF